ncbi:MAG TPA: hypothetical protein VL595_26710 [Pseudonocardia sp.]|jgi:hypothetical protein|nr:hypothetical protein [Pseudonocardia sp.]
MGNLPHIDEHVRVVGAGQERTWSALLRYVSHSLGRPLPEPLVSAWGLEPPRRTGDWRRPETGATIPGFVVAEVEPPGLLTLRGRHRFSRYELRFAIEPVGPDRVKVRAGSSGEFPGALGRLYRGLVIGSRGHVLAVRHMLAQVAARAERDVQG